MVFRACNPGTQEAESGDLHKFEARLLYKEYQGRNNSKSTKMVRLSVNTCSQAAPQTDSADDGGVGGDGSAAASEVGQRMVLEGQGNQLAFQGESWAAEGERYSLMPLRGGSQWARVK